MALSLLYRATQDLFPGAELESGRASVHWTIRDVQTHSRALWAALITGINIAHFPPRGDYSRMVEPKLDGVGTPLDLAAQVEHSDYPRTLSDGSLALNLFLAICKQVGYQSRFYKKIEEVESEPEGPELSRSIDELSDRSSQREVPEGRCQKDILSAKMIFEFMPWRTVALGAVGVLLGLLLARANPSGGGVVHQLQ